MIYFISGHRDLTLDEFETHYIPLLNKILEDDPYARFLVGDWEGCDEYAVRYLITKPVYPIITIYCVDGPRSKFLQDLVFQIGRIHTKLCKTYDECDASMTADSHFDVTWIRPGRGDSHTAGNIKRRYEDNIS